MKPFARKILYVILISFSPMTPATAGVHDGATAPREKRVDGIDWTRVVRQPTNLVVSIHADGEWVSFDYAFKMKGGGGWTSVASVPWVPGAKGDGISFEVMGDGSSFYVSLFLSTTSTLTAGYEAIFPLSSTEWKKVTIRWDDFAQNRHMGGDPKLDGTQDMILDPSRITWLGFGTGSTLHKFRPETYSFKIRKVQVEPSIPALPAMAKGNGISRTLVKIKGKETIKVLLLGDSITDFGGDRSYFYFVARKLKAEYGCDFIITNAAIGGNTVRYGTVQLTRSLDWMPDPDLVFLMYGANDCKETEVRADYTSGTFQAHLVRLIQKIRDRTKGQADFAVVNGVPRLDKEQMGTTGAVEKVAPGSKAAAVQTGSGFVDTLSTYLSLEAMERKGLYSDTIHPNAKGHEYLGNLVYEMFRQELSR